MRMKKKSTQREAFLKQNNLERCYNPFISRAHTKPPVQRNRDVKPPTPVSNIAWKFQLTPVITDCHVTSCNIGLTNTFKQLQAKHEVEKNMQ